MTSARLQNTRTCHWSRHARDILYPMVEKIGRVEKLVVTVEGAKFCCSATCWLDQYKPIAIHIATAFVAD